MGAIPINDAQGHRVAMILPQPKSGQTQAIATAFERLPAIIHAARHLDLLANTPGQPDISIANAWRDLRRALGGIDLETQP
jgi:hypothetical protein